ncbi:hypothetical protein B0T26DRAFT_747039 [Lasiosphaeria miniovina]|uniref:Uncharacterized protein n=1 Tax=Lasiosphaeria miniovina TaxID=1954250 RepID=A0AA40BJ79_9PEZI|nr:uncharacterized protein B0T26DRAFT_747039 [Lasiosphaeria miniovina]KAK0735225.1 hypothetical protein B0T26DRAFT_747039 [Lasiosphaeria miniovina]
MASWKEMKSSKSLPNASLITNMRIWARSYFHGMTSMMLQTQKGVHLTSWRHISNALMRAEKVPKPWPGSGDRNPRVRICSPRTASTTCLLLGQGGTETNHSATIARAASGDAAGGRWAIARWRLGRALSELSSPWAVFSMGRETVFMPMGWEAEKWPALDPVQGRMTAALPAGEALRVELAGAVAAFRAPSEVVVALPAVWIGKKLWLTVKATMDGQFVFG